MVQFLHSAFLDHNAIFIGSEHTESFLPSPSHNKTDTGLIAGCLIATQRGMISVENLQIGDLVLTRDEGYQPLRWIGRIKANAEDLLVTIAAGAFGNGLPLRELRLGRHHHVLLVLHPPQGRKEVLVTAEDCVGMEGVYLHDQPQGQDKWQLVFDQHQIIMAEGLPTESLCLHQGCPNSMLAFQQIGSRDHENHSLARAVWPKCWTADILDQSA